MTARKNHKTSRIFYADVYQSGIKLTSNTEELKDIRIHDFGHSWATERVGILQIEEIRASMGHENIQITLRYFEVTSQHT
ncbi:MAG: hypothetical protein WBF90_12895 [Rivularia sp. (in: cyanobacteria)]